MAALGRRKLELWGIAPQFHIPQLDNAAIRAVRRQLSDRQLEAHCVTVEQVMYPVNIASPVDWLRNDSIALFRRAAQVCNELQAPLLFLTPGRGFEDEDLQRAWRRSVDALGEIASYAATLGVDCVLEPLQRVESNLVNDSQALRRMIDDVGASNLGAVLDTVAMAAAGETVQDYVRNLDTLIRHVHLIDGCPTGHLAWGDGDLPLGTYVAELERAGYDGYFTFELFGDGTYAFDPRPALERCLNAFDRAVEPRT
ncbi:TIM barrel protein [Arthrobacter sp. JZ12]|nr:TIM barrel protein [Arthrobacter sp. JZ12]